MKHFYRAIVFALIASMCLTLCVAAQATGFGYSNESTIPDYDGGFNEQESVFYVNGQYYASTGSFAKPTSVFTNNSYANDSMHGLSQNTDPSFADVRSVIRFSDGQLGQIIAEYNAIASNDKANKKVNSVVKDYKKYVALTSDLESIIQGAATNTINTCSPGVYAPHPTLTMQSWKYIASIMPLIKTEAQLQSIIKVSGDFIINADRTKSYMLYIKFEDFRTAAQQLAGDDGVAYTTAIFMYAYLNTVFDRGVGKISFVQPNLPVYMYNSLVFPVSEYRNIRKTWYASRDNGTRKHTGTDILAPEGVELLSCTDGTVVCTGYADKFGYFAVIRDANGYEFDYFHLMQQASVASGQEVSAGQVIGYCGNTGNSSVPHLHISIITPGITFVNPYSLMIAASER